MDRLVDDYEKAARLEVDLRIRKERLAERLAVMETAMLVCLITDEPKLPQWKVSAMVTNEMGHVPNHQDTKANLLETERDHAHAELNTNVALERLKLTQARLHGGHHDLLDMQEVAPAPDTVVD